MSTDFGTPPPEAPRSSKTNTLAIVAVVCGGIGLVMSFCCGLFGVPVDIAAIACGGIALSQIKRTMEQGRGMAMGGLVMGVLGLVLAIAMFFLGVAIQGLPQFQQMQQQMQQPDGELGAPGDLEFELGPAENAAPAPAGE
ncbi:MAG: DUF4190 domain-containing protein [Planctomycetaceae bacterium]